MKNTFIVFCLKIMELTMQILVFAVVLMALVIGFFGNKNVGAVRCIVAAGVSVTALFLVRAFVRNKPLFFALHIGIFIFFTMLSSDDSEKIAFILIGIALVIYSIVKSASENRRFGEQMPAALAGLFAAAVILGAYTEKPELEKGALYCGIVYIIIQVVYHNLNNLYDIMAMNKDMANFPARQLVSVNSFIMTIVVIICAGVMVLFNSTYVYKMLDGIKSLIFGFLKMILRRLFGNNEEDAYVPEIPTEEAASVPDFNIVPEEGGGPWKDIVNGIAVAIGVAIIVAIVIMIVVAVVQFLRKVNGGKLRYGDIREFVEPEGIERIRLKKRQTIRKEEDEPRSAKARKIYKAMAAKNAAAQGEKISYNMTAQEISDRYIAQSADKVTLIYEKARYGNVEITKNELEMLKEVRKAKI